MKPRDELNTYFISDRGQIILVPLTVLEVAGNVCSCQNRNTGKIGIYNTSRLQKKSVEVDKMLKDFIIQLYMKKNKNYINLH